MKVATHHVLSVVVLLYVQGVFTHLRNFHLELVNIGIFLSHDLLRNRHVFWRLNLDRPVRIKQRLLLVQTHGLV